MVQLPLNMRSSTFVLSWAPFAFFKLLCEQFLPSPLFELTNICWKVNDNLLWGCKKFSMYIYISLSITEKIKIWFVWNSTDMFVIPNYIISSWYYLANSFVYTSKYWKEFRYIMVCAMDDNHFKYISIKVRYFRRYEIDMCCSYALNVF